MFTRSLFAIATALLATSTNALDINGWYPCGLSYQPEYYARGNASAPVLETPAPFECAEVVMPLCHSGVCRSGENINVFVKRLPAKNGNQSQRGGKAVWMVQGGPGASSVDMEPRMLSIHEDLGGDVAVYTMDHRGTGRSHVLQCEAAQAFMDGSPEGTDVALEETPNCLKDLNFQYKNNVAAFSVTSAATDLKVLIEDLNRGQDVYAFGYSYGTLVLQRLAQLRPQPVKGYMFDGVSVMTTKKDKYQSGFSHDNLNILDPSRRLLEYCFDDPECPLKFKSRKTVIDEVLAIYKQLDDEKETNACSQLLLQAGVYETPSANLRASFGILTAMTRGRAGYPLILSKFQSCSPDDVEMLKSILVPWMESGPANTDAQHRRRLLTQRAKESSRRKRYEPEVFDPVRENNMLLFSMIIASEIWSEPSPTVDEFTSFYTSGPFTMPSPLVTPLVDWAKNATDLPRIGNGLLDQVCLFTGMTDPVCKAIASELPPSPPFFYKHDKYYDAPIALADTASALIITGGLDFQTPAEMGDLLLKKLRGGRGKRLVSFAYGGHCSGEATAESSQTPCRDAIVAQFVMKGGDVKAIDTSCLKTTPTIKFPVTIEPPF